MNGEKNGKGKEYNKDGNIIFEGEYYNDKKWNGIGYIKHIKDPFNKYGLKQVKDY